MSGVGGAARPPIEVVFDLLDARRRHDIAAVGNLLAPGVVHDGVTPDLRCRDREEVLHNVRRSFDRDEQEIDHLELVTAGAEAVIVGMSGARFRDAPWASLGSQLFVLHTVREGLVVRMQDFVRRGDAFRAAGADPVGWA